MTDDMKIICPSCDAENAGDQEKCGNCGEPIFGKSLNDEEYLESQSDRKDALFVRIIVITCLTIAAIVAISVLVRR